MSETAWRKNPLWGGLALPGLLSGDHLHFGVYVQGVPVRPLEWWDAKWIDDNIWYKINYVKKNLATREAPR